MLEEIKKLELSTLKTQLDQKKREFDAATESQRPHAELSPLYKEFKLLQQESNLRAIGIKQ